MNYEEFISEVKKYIIEKMGNDTKVSVHQVVKNNGIVLDGLVIMEKNRRYSPTIYLNSFYSQFLEGEEFQSIIETIMNIYSTNCDKLSVPEDFFTNFSELRDKVTYKLINFEKNKALLEKIPHRKWKDLALVYCVVCDCLDDDRAVVMIYNNHMKIWGVEEENLYDLARENTPRLYPAMLRPMNEIVRDMFFGDCMEERDEKEKEELLIRLEEMNKEFPMFVLTNQMKHCGAACILYDDLLKNFTDLIDDDIFIIPSSIHEVIIIPKKQNVNKDTLLDMVLCVNREELDAGEILADNVYEFDRNCGFIN